MAQNKKKKQNRFLKLDFYTYNHRTNQQKKITKKLQIELIRGISESIYPKSHLSKQKQQKN